MNVMAAASSGKEVETEPVLEGPMWKETVTSEQGETLEEENKLAPREGTKEHMMTIEVSKCILWTVYVQWKCAPELYSVIWTS